MIHRRALEFYVERSSPIHRLPASVKLGAALALVFLAALSARDKWPFLVILCAALLAMIPLCRLPAVTTLKRLLLLEPFAAGVALLAWFQPNGGLVFASMIAKSTTCLLVMILLTSTTSFPSLLSALRTFRVPHLLVTTLALLYRYLFLLLDESTRLRMSRRSRTYVEDRALVRFSLAATAAQLFVRASLRSERVYAAMCSRGWNP